MSEFFIVDPCNKNNNNYQVYWADRIHYYHFRGSASTSTNITDSKSESDYYFSDWGVGQPATCTYCIYQKVVQSLM